MTFISFFSSYAAGQWPGSNLVIFALDWWLTWPTLLCRIAHEIYSGLKSNIHITHHRGFSVLYSMGWIHYIMFPSFHFFFLIADYRAELLGNLIKDICQSLKIGLFSLLLPKLNILDKSHPVEWKDISYIYFFFFKPLYISCLTVTNGNLIRERATVCISTVL